MYFFILAELHLKEMEPILEKKKSFEVNIFKTKRDWKNFPECKLNELQKYFITIIKKNFFKLFIVSPSLLLFSKIF